MKKMDSQDSSPVHNPHSVDEARNQTTMTPKNRFPWATIIIVLILILIVGTIILLAQA
ncbi:hypothetical protein B0O79_1344 [Flavobacteriaceae bacterium MAR_2009_75]|uniref:hypothetical protein n=1 Tax=Pseudozobellia sp. WGM2 TaxID=2787625 RepID=UPI000CB3321C|nr:hypothetical protein [Pseudozobellia sp. WGM2]PKA97675.1 hypothetical protein B0O79_1344 [Flavobacteriaceae bacterium MAR_2009_75]